MDLFEESERKIQQYQTQFLNEAKKLIWKWIEHSKDYKVRGFDGKEDGTFLNEESLSNYMDNRHPEIDFNLSDPRSLQDSVELFEKEFMECETLDEVIELMQDSKCDDECLSEFFYHLLTSDESYSNLPVASAIIQSVNDRLYDFEYLEKALYNYHLLLMHSRDELCVRDDEEIYSPYVRLTSRHLRQLEQDGFIDVPFKETKHLWIMESFLQIIGGGIVKKNDRYIDSDTEAEVEVID